MKKYLFSLQLSLLIVLCLATPLSSFAESTITWDSTNNVLHYNIQDNICPNGLGYEYSVSENPPPTDPPLPVDGDFNSLGLTEEEFAAYVASWNQIVDDGIFNSPTDMSYDFDTFSFPGDSNPVYGTYHAYVFCYDGDNPGYYGNAYQYHPVISETFTWSAPEPTSEVKIEASPASGSKTVGSPFVVNLAVNSDEDAFNAVRATVSVSSNLTINSINAPDSNACNLHYTQTPTTGNPSFAGAIYGSSSESCNVYRMVVTPNAEGTGTITLTNGSVKSYADNSEILTGVTNASFTLTNGTEPTPTPLLEFQVNSPAQTYKANYDLAGTKLTTITSIFVNGSDEDSTYPTSTTWSVPVTLTLGNNTYTIYGSDGSNQTATQTFAVDRHILGDINGDGEIDLIDASLFAVDWDKTEDLTYVLSDMNDDGVVDLTDLSILAKLQE